MISVGTPVPEFELDGADGKKIHSSDFAGSRYVIYFYPKDFTPGCTIEADEFSTEYDRFLEEGIGIVGISPDDTSSHKKFCTKMGIKYSLLADVDKKVSKMFGVWGKKKFMGKEYMGVMRSTFLVDVDGIIFKIYSKVKPSGHASQVFEEFTQNTS